MKRIIAIFLILIVLVQSSMKLAIVSFYELNKAYITANFCENKEKPALKCDGKCFLAKKIKAVDEHEKKDPSVQKGMEEVLLFCNSIEIAFKPQFPEVIITFQNTYLLKNYPSPSTSIFQPPC